MAVVQHCPLTLCRQATHLEISITRPCSPTTRWPSCLRRMGGHWASSLISGRRSGSSLGGRPTWVTCPMWFPASTPSSTQAPPSVTTPRDSRWRQVSSQYIMIQACHIRHAKGEKSCVAVVLHCAKKRDRKGPVGMKINVGYITVNRIIQVTNQTGFTVLVL